MFTKKETECLKKLLISAINQQRSQSRSEALTEEDEQTLISLVSAHNKIKLLNNKLSKQSTTVTMPRILVVDDADSMLGVMTQLLFSIGFTKVDTAKSAERALSMLLEAAKIEKYYDIVITDWEMTGKSGLDLLKQIRLHEHLLETDVYILSSHCEQENILQAIQAGVTGYMLKPINAVALQKKLGFYLPDKN
ncbi:response regulator [Shewanella maritima]|uniref:response regulator n=1 Tax=Shewanella maritima TaxID=2520507 RepID=UPI003735BBB8